MNGPARETAASDLEAGVLEVELALDPAHDLVVDAPGVAQLEQDPPLRLEELAKQSLVGGRALLVARGVAAVLEAGREATPAVVVLKNVPNLCDGTSAGGCFGRVTFAGIGLVGTKRFGFTGARFPDLDPWSLPPLLRGREIEARLRTGEYSGWWNLGSDRALGENFPLVDFQLGRALVSLKTVDPASSSSLSRMQAHIRALADSDARVDGQPATLGLDVRVPPGTAGGLTGLDEYGQLYDVRVNVSEYP